MEKKDTLLLFLRKTGEGSTECLETTQRPRGLMGLWVVSVLPESSLPSPLLPP